MTPHNEANVDDIAKVVIMPGDPLRTKYIAEKYLTDYKLVNKVRNMYAYTGFYKGKRITIMAHGMGIPSMGIYSYELYKIYDVDTIIRIGSCGSYSKDLKLFDIILSEKCYTESNYALTFNNDNCHIILPDEETNNIIYETSKENNLFIHKGNTVTTDCFDPYMPNVEGFLNRIPKDFNPLSAEMEAFSLFYNAKLLNKKAACLMSISDSKFLKENISPEDRQTGLDNMIKLALDSAYKICK